MEIEELEIPDLKILRPRVFADERGWFMESFNARSFAEATGFANRFVQDNVSMSRAGVLRGLHYQIKHPQGKLVRALEGEIFDVAVDLRRSSPSFLRWAGIRLSAEKAEWLWIPPGFAHGFAVQSESARILYKTTEYYRPECERTLVWNDPGLGIDWPVHGNPILSEKDLRGTPLALCEVYGGRHEDVISA